MKAEEFGQILKEIRKRRKLTIRQLELYSGVSNGYLSQLETGKRGIPSPEILKKLANPLGIEYEELMKIAGYIDTESSVIEDETETIKFGRKIREIREGKKLSHDVFAKLIGLSTEELLLLEEDKDVPTFDDLNAIASFSGITVSQLMGLDSPLSIGNIVLPDEEQSLITDIVNKLAACDSEERRRLIDILESIVKNFIPRGSDPK